MYAVVRDYWGDLGDYVHWPLTAWFDFVRLIPYEADNTRFPTRILELVARPKYLLDRALFPALDCKKKSILMGSWAQGHGYPYHFLAVSQRPDGGIHHVFPRIRAPTGEWMVADATLPDYQLGCSNPITHAVELMP